MKPEEQRIAIAEFCEPHQAWEIYEDIYVGAKEPYQKRVGYRYPVHSGWIDAPDYLNDLNAMHEAEKYIFNHKQWHTYTDFLIDKVQGKNESPIRATAAQRSEALLRTIGKWKDS